MHRCACKQQGGYHSATIPAGLEIMASPSRHMDLADLAERLCELNLGILGAPCPEPKRSSPAQRCSPRTHCAHCECIVSDRSDMFLRLATVLTDHVSCLASARPEWCLCEPHGYRRRTCATHCSQSPGTPLSSLHLHPSRPRHEQCQAPQPPEDQGGDRTEPSERKRADSGLWYDGESTRGVYCLDTALRSLQSVHTSHLSVFFLASLVLTYNSCLLVLRPVFPLTARDLD